MKQASRKYNRVVIDSEFTATSHNGRQQGAGSTASTVAAKSVPPASQCPYGVHRR